jgi:endoglucanase
MLNQKFTTNSSIISILFLLLFSANLQASKLVNVLPVDNKCIVLHFQDGAVEYNWDDTISGSCNGWDYFHTEKWSLCPDKDQYIAYGSPLNTAAVKQISSFLILSKEDSNFGEAGKNPIKIYRKSKVWEASHDEKKAAMHHWIYLELPFPLETGKSYTVRINSETNSGENLKLFTFNEFVQESPAIKISNIGYEATAVFKSADVYLWMGDGGGRDFSNFTGTPFFLVDVYSGEKAFSGKLEFRTQKKAEPEFDRDFTGADVWECDFSAFNKTGTYKLVIEGIGSSNPFVIANNQFEEAFKVAMQGMFYLRMGCDEKPAGDYPKARRPLYKQGVEPVDFKVEISKKEMVTGTNPDDRNWYSEELTGEIAKETWGGWVDAYDNDQRPVNFICVFDILLAYYLNPDHFTDNQLYIPETKNNIPDLIDEALWEIDWWLRMRDSKGGYLTGLTNILPPQNVNYAGNACAWQGWCVAAGCAMVADCFRLNNNTMMQEKYTKEAIEAYHWAKRQTDNMLEINVDGLRGKDLKMTAASFLYNLTGDTIYENVVVTESEAKSGESKIRNMGNWEQQYASVGYIFTPQKVNYAELQSNMKKAVINQAKTDYVDKMEQSPTKAARSVNKWEGMMQTSNEMSMVAVAHKISESESEKKYFEKGMYAEAEWTLGRNPLGLVQMTGLGEHCFTQTFAPGRRDGYAGLTPGWTPYMCRDGWMRGDDDIHGCDWYTIKNYPHNKEDWPWGEHFWNSRYCVPNGETTPQQTIRQKIVLYGYLYALAKEINN